MGGHGHVHPGRSPPVPSLWGHADQRGSSLGVQGLRMGRPCALGAALTDRRSAHTSRALLLGLHWQDHSSAHGGSHVRQRCQELPSHPAGHRHLAPGSTPGLSLPVPKLPSLLPGSEQPGRSQASERLLRTYPLLCREKLWSQWSPGMELPRTGFKHTLPASSLTTGQDGCVSDKLICSFQGAFLMNLSVFTDH